MKKGKGFTLIELMIVVAIIGILAAIAIPRFAQLIDKAREAGARGNLGALRSAIAIYYGDNKGIWPRTLDTQGSTVFGESIPGFIPGYMGRIPNATLRRGLTTPHSNNTNTVTYANTGVNEEIQKAMIVEGANGGGWIYSRNSGDCRINCNHYDSVRYNNNPNSTIYYSNYGHEEP